MKKYFAVVMIALMLLHPVAAGTSYIRANQQLIARVNDDGSVDYYQLDGFKNVRSLFNESGLKEIQDYLPFGTALFQTPTDLQYKSHLLEWVSNLYGLYSTHTGRRLVPAPALFAAGTQFLNGYFVTNNPFKQLSFRVPNLFSTASLEQAPRGAVSSGSISGAGPTRAAFAPNLFSYTFNFGTPLQRIAMAGKGVGAAITIASIACSVFCKPNPTPEVEEKKVEVTEEGRAIEQALDDPDVDKVKIKTATQVADGEYKIEEIEVSSVKAEIGRLEQIVIDYEKAGGVKEGFVLLKDYGVLMDDGAMRYVFVNYNEVPRTYGINIYPGDTFLEQTVVQWTAASTATDTNP
ncbi:MAG: hypothetical protein H8D38_06365 [DPANN group archaeon]|nr:hypothetical protein [DPANN group archaeon]